MAPLYILIKGFVACSLAKSNIVKQYLIQERICAQRDNLLAFETGSVCVCVCVCV